MSAPLSAKCPRCDSPAPNLHPAMQADGGEVQPCTHPFHGKAPQVTAPLSPERLVATAEEVEAHYAASTVRTVVGMYGIEVLAELVGGVRTVVPALLAEIERLTAEQGALARWQERVTEEVEEFEDAAQGDLATPQVARNMIRLLRLAMNDGAA